MAEEFLTEAFVRLKGRWRPQAEDALQEAFCRLWGRKYNLRSEREAEALLARTSRNISIDEARKRQRRPTVPLDERIRWGEEEVYSAQEREALFRQVEASIDRELSKTQRRILRRHEYEGVTLEKIAEEMGMQPAAVRMQISRARKALREKFRKEYENV
ncbi:MAG: RNA polymerase sigma factor [Candidatus Cryptobacteroides sp.]|jgi:RNA polymerase sigma factor (sigma-70 family)